MSGDQDAQARLEQIIEKHVQSGNVVPFPTMPRQRKSKPEPSVSVRGPVSVRGTGNAVVGGSHNRVTIRVTQRRVVADVKPGRDHITDDQAARLQQLVQDLHARTEKNFQAIWCALLRHVHAPKYRLIRLAQFPQAEGYLVRWLARTTRPDLDEAQARNRHIRYIKTNERKLDRPEGELTRFLQEHFGKGSLRECSIDDLVTVRRLLVARWRHTF